MKLKISPNTRHLVVALVILLSGGILWNGCGSVRHADRVAAGAAPTGSHYTLILFYDPAIGDKPLLKAIKHYKGTVLYLYRNFNGMAVSVPTVTPEEEAIRYFRQVKGVLSVQRNRKMQLFDNTLP